MDRALHEIVPAVESDLSAITSTWEHQPIFETDYEVTISSRSVVFSTTDDIFHYLNHGTSVRYAHMTPGFRPKTRHYALSSKSGSGGFSYLGRPLTGIAPREWGFALAEKYAPIFSTRLHNLLARDLDSIFTKP